MYAKILLMTAFLLSGQVYAQSAAGDLPTDASATTPTTLIKAKKKKKKVSAPKAKTTTKASKASAKTSSAAITAPTAPVTPVTEVKKEEAKKVESRAANTAATTTPQKVLKYLKDKFSASYHGEYYFVRRDVESSNPADHDIQDVKIMHNPTVTYKPFTDWQFLATGEFKYTDAPPGTAEAGSFFNNYYRSLFTISKNNIITEKEHGFKLDAGIGRRDFNTRVVPGTFGNDRVFATVTKTYGKNNGSLFIQYLYDDPKKSVATTRKHGLELIPTINYQITEKLSYLFNDDINFNTPKFKTTERDLSISHEMNVAYLNYKWTDKVNTYYQLMYYHTEDFTNAVKDDYSEHYAGIGYAFTPKITLTGEVGSEILHAYTGRPGGRSFFSKKAHFPEFAMYFDAAL